MSQLGIALLLPVLSIGNFDKDCRASLTISLLSIALRMLNTYIGTNFHPALHVSPKHNGKRRYSYMENCDRAALREFPLKTFHSPHLNRFHLNPLGIIIFTFALTSSFSFKYNTTASPEIFFRSDCNRCPAAARGCLPPRPERAGFPEPVIRTADQNPH